MTDIQMPAALDTLLHAFIEAPSADATEEAFNALALRLFAFQFERNAAYRSYCERRGATPGRVAHWSDMPAVPTAAFKSVRLATFPDAEEVCLLKTSGTSQQADPGRVHLDAPGLALAAASWRRMGEELLFAENRVHRALLLAPSPDEAPHMNMAYAVEHAFSARQLHEKRYFLHAGKLEVPELIEALRHSERSGEPVAVFGASFGYVHLMESLEERGLRFHLPAGSLVMDGGGYKGRSRELSPAEFAAAVERTFGVPSDHWINVLGMTEMMTAWADGMVVDRLTGVERPRVKRSTHWTRTRVVSAETLETLPHGETGLLRHWCLANRSTVLAVQTDDLGREVGDGFQILGRAAGAEARGCSIAMDELLSAAAGTA
jgi:hypothetical protein